MEWREARPGCAQCGLGITASPNADGTLSFNVATLDAALNSDFSGALGVLPEREQPGAGIQDHAEQCGHKFNQWDRRARSEIQQQRGEESGCCAASGIVPTMSNAGLKHPRQSCWAPLVSGSKHDRGVHNEFGDFRAIA